MDEPDTSRALRLDAGALAQEADGGARRRAPRAMESADLFRGERTVEINHNGVIYRLQATRLGKLILTK
ncbi:hemin uptake protein HemP [Polaromonas sp. C04]|uniref:hemin uptake protein HemP n=1 Tax=Polaromonas sp. C04 TaxID=1945857 RepID=UPI00336BF2C3